MSNTQARRLTAILVLICVILLTSCGNLFNLLFSDSKEEDVKNTKNYGGNTAVEKIIAYMNATYDDTFEYVKPTGVGIGAEETEIIMKSEKFPDEEIWGYYCPSWEGERESPFFDNYILIKYRQQTNEKIKAALEELFGEAELIFDEDDSIRQFDRSRFRDSTFEEYIADDNNLVSFTVIVDSSYTVESQSDFEKSFSKAFNGISCPVTSIIVFAVDQGLFDRLKSGEITDSEYFRWIRKSSVEPEASTIEHMGIELHTYTARDDDFKWRVYQ